MKPKSDSVLDVYIKENEASLSKLKEMREHFKAINKQVDSIHVQSRFLD